MTNLQKNTVLNTDTLQDIFDHVPVGIGVAGPIETDGTIKQDARIVYYNKEWIRLFGFDAKEVCNVAQATHRLYPEPQLLQKMLSQRREAAERRQRGENAAQFETQAMGADGQWRDVVTGTAVIHGMMIVSMMDITIRKQAERSLMQALKAAKSHDDYESERIAVHRSGSARQMIPVESIVAVVGDDKYSRVISGSSEYPDKRALSEWHTLLQTSGFARIDRSTLLSPERIESIRPFGRGAHIAFLNSTHVIQVGRAGRERLEKLFSLRKQPRRITSSCCG